MFEHFLKEVTGKNLVQVGFHPIAKTQDANNIYASDIAEAVHEICHFIFASQEQRKMPNLGWENYNEACIPSDLLIQEVKACLYTKTLIEKLLEKKIIEFSDLTKKSIGYAEYLIDAGKNLAEKNLANITVTDEEIEEIDKIIKNYLLIHSLILIR
jgi:hypothetical protein